MSSGGRAFELTNALLAIQLTRMVGCVRAAASHAATDRARVALARDTLFFVRLPAGQQGWTVWMGEREEAAWITCKNVCSSHWRMGY